MRKTLNNQFSQKIKLAKQIKHNRKENCFSLDHSFLNSFNKKINPAYLKKCWTAFATEVKETQKKDNIDFYIHIPYCQSRCRYCQYNSEVLENEKQLDDYIDYIIDYMSYYKAVFKNISFEHFYVGGGSPSILSASQIDRLLTFVNNNYNFKKKDIKQREFSHTFELFPSLTNIEKLAILRKHGINRVSFGIQSFNELTLKKENRKYVSPEILKELVDEAKNLGFKAINVDMIVGLNDEKEQEMVKSLKKLCEIGPTAITLYTIQRNIETSFLYSTASAFYKNIEKIFESLEKILHDYDYNGNIGKDSIALGSGYPKKGAYSFSGILYELYAHKGRSLFAVGDDATGLIFGSLRYENLKNIRKFNTAEMSARALKISIKDEMASNVLRQLRTGSLLNNSFLDVFGTEVEGVFSKELNFLKENNILEEFEKGYRWKTKSNGKKAQYSSVLISDNILRLMATKKHIIHETPWLMLNSANNDVLESVPVLEAVKRHIFGFDFYAFKISRDEYKLAFSNPKTNEDLIVVLTKTDKPFYKKTRSKRALYYVGETITENQKKVLDYLSMTL